MSIDKTIKKIDGLPNKGKIYTDGESIMGVETVCTTDDLKSLVAHIERLEDRIREFERATEEVVQEYHLRSCDCSEPLTLAVERLEAALDSKGKERES